MPTPIYLKDHPEWRIHRDAQAASLKLFLAWFPDETVDEELSDEQYELFNNKLKEVADKVKPTIMALPSRVPDDIDGQMTWFRGKLHKENLKILASVPSFFLEQMNIVIEAERQVHYGAALALFTEAWEHLTKEEAEAYFIATINSALN